MAPPEELLAVKPESTDPDIEYVEVTELVAKNSWYDFVQFLSGNEEVVEELQPEEPVLAVPTTAPPEPISISTPVTEEPRNNPSFSQVMASIVSEKGVHESSDEENPDSNDMFVPLTRTATVTDPSELLPVGGVANSNDFPN